MRTRRRHFDGPFCTGVGCKPRLELITKILQVSNNYRDFENHTLSSEFGIDVVVLRKIMRLYELRVVILHLQKVFSKH